ncbi:ankyrin repeat domain-containing protein [Leptospira yasudae]|uniref:ankyrin repeat domain-containing protein n=1 Tax=Leptospira yasudae TaxID=2202201 RepID=UPI00108275F7|nr:ankyrin repeat domain-containing protein [Leptospira yasudae]TGK30559.1 ankyrin repeat domain-containing protein [Leptospira yasudae]TGM04061.1 ankyrin repeat domain-containing protein [Leptospira yasudae]
MKNFAFFVLIALLLCDCSHDTKLIRAIKERNLEEARSLLRRGENVNAIGECYNALSVAVMNGNPDFIELLLSSGSDPNVRNYECFKPIPYGRSVPIGRDTAIIYSTDLNITKMLIGYGADPNILDIHGDSALKKAILRGLDDITGYLISKGANVNLFNKDGKNIHLEALKTLQDSKPNIYERILNLLTNANAKDLDLNTIPSDSSIHDRYRHSVCGNSTKMEKNLAETITKRPQLFSPQTYCASERAFSHFSEFSWEDNGQNMMHWYIKRLKDVKTSPTPAPKTQPQTHSNY